MRIAWCSPLPPYATGVADYSAGLIPELAKRVELEVFAPGDPGSDLDARPLSGLRDGSDHDAVLYHLGNNLPAHGEIYRVALRRPGIVVLHEYMLHDLVRGLALADSPDAYLEEMRYSYGNGGLRTGRRFLEIGAGLDLWAYPLFERVVDSGRGVIVHNETARRRILASRPQAAVEVVPHYLRPLSAGASSSTARLRNKLGLPERGLIVAAFGSVSQVKRMDVALRGFAALRRRRDDAVFLLVGDGRPLPGLTSLLSSDLGRGVVATGRVDEQGFKDAMRVTDLAINLRYPVGGESSGTLVRLMGLGKPVIVSDAGSFSEIPDGCCARIAVDHDEELNLAACLLTLAGDEALRRDIGNAARAWIEARAAMPHCLDAYESAIRKISRVAFRPAAAVPPLAPYPAGDVGTRLIADVAAGLEDLGVPPDDDVLLREIARTLTDLKLNGPGPLAAVPDSWQDGRRSAAVRRSRE